MENNHFFSSGTSTIFYRVCGEGKPVVLLHGFGEDGNIWSVLANHLKNNFRVIIPDIPGSGKSTILESTIEISIDDYAKVIVDIIKKENVTNCTIIGHSMGGYITLSIAEKYPEVLNGFGLFHSTAFADTEEKKSARTKSIEFMKENEGITFLKKSIPELFAGKFRQQHADIIEKLVESVKYLSSESLMQYYRAMINRPDRSKVLQRSGVPVLFIIGEQDPAIPLQQSLAQCHMPSLAYINLLQDSGHMGILEEPDLCADIVNAYLSNV